MKLAISCLPRLWPHFLSLVVYTSIVASFLGPIHAWGEPGNEATILCCHV